MANNGYSELVTALRLNMTHQPGGEHEERYLAALEMAEYADAHGFTAINCEEHHLARGGWLPSPLLLAAAVAARTRRIRVNVAALLVPLYDPVRLAEDIAVLDNLSAGRFSFVAGLGYRREEYEALGREWSRRGELMDECLDVMLRAWGAEPFEYRGRTIDVTPKPRTKPHPLCFIGGMSERAASRAARFGLPFYPPMPMPELERRYREESRARGHHGFVYRPGPGGNTMTLLHPDPDSAWPQYFPYLQAEAAEYWQWRVEGLRRPGEFASDSLEGLRRSGKYEILTPAQCVDGIRSGRTELVINPLIGGLPVAEGWRTLRLFVQEVRPALESG
ncbi:LLM class flavin-dependent oxidoreductase [Nocardia sp. NPDC048505]|uniref:LLM class flavin-dependent oxidoreductase n=1 Tax=unclassified Nocardia TaxID=2637762 RepID=UPI0033DB6108